MGKGAWFLQVVFTASDPTRVSSNQVTCLHGLPGSSLQWVHSSTPVPGASHLAHRVQCACLHVRGREGGTHWWPPTCWLGGGQRLLKCSYNKTTRTPTDPREGEMPGKWGNKTLSSRLWGTLPVMAQDRGPGSQVLPAEAATCCCNWHCTAI